MKDSKGGALISSPTHSSQQFQNCPITDEEYLACTLVPIFSTLSFILFAMKRQQPGFETFFMGDWNMAKHSGYLALYSRNLT